MPLAPVCCIPTTMASQVDLSDPFNEANDFSTTNDLNNDWTMNFSNFISRYHKPQNPCDYCRLRHLDCFLTFEGQTGCSPCKALFRNCSFEMPSQQRNKPRNVIDTLHHVSEDTCQEFGALTSTKTLVGIKTDEDRAARKSGIRFSRAAVKILTEWIVNHSDHPYPTEEEKGELRQRTGLTENQVNNWLANARRRKKHKPKRPVSPSLQASGAMDIPSNKTWSDLNPMERYLDSPPENEPAPWTAIQQAVKETTPPRGERPSRSAHTSRHPSTGSSGPRSHSRRAPSTASLEIASVNSGMSSQAESLGSVWSFTSRNSGGSFGSFGSFGSVNGIRKERRRRRRPDIKKQASENDKKTKLFQCTFCTDAFKSKYDWARHEKSLHLSLEKWICAPLGPVITCTASGQRKCVFCDTIDPTKDHLETHNWSACEERSPEQRTFYRKDHLRQHMRLMHNCKLTETMESWKSETQYIKSRCGFCRMTFETWQDRVDHLAKEFRNGSQMKDWKGCRGFDPQVALLITNAMPPYLIANEAKSPNPFRASQPASLAWHTTHHPTMDYNPNRYDAAAAAGFFHEDQNEGLPVPGLHGTTNTSSSSLSTPQEFGMTPEERPTINATCWEILTVRLGKYAKQQLSQGVLPTDAMLQREARRILYDSDDGWEQTAADNPEWLELFKKAHGLAGDEKDYDKRDILEDLGMLGDVASYVPTGDWMADMPAVTCSDSTTGPLNFCHANMMLGGPATCSWAPASMTATTGITTASTEGIFDLEGLSALSALSFDTDESTRRQTWNGFPGIVNGSTGSAP
ncbi:Homeobox and c2h2 transcription factor [Neofusicoccum parvum]|nr:Homeobox and c2h2 transcription factor [Neofusicoccum parvum]